MTITLPGLMAADTGAVRAFADHLERVAHRIDEAVGDFGAATRDLPHYWSSGPGSESAVARDAALRQQLSVAYDPVNYGARVIREFAGYLDQYRQMVHSVVAEAEGKGFRVDLGSGAVTGTNPLAGETPTAGLQAAQSTAEYYAGLLGDILTQANARDSEAAGSLAMLRTGGVELSSVPAEPQLPTNATADTFIHTDPAQLAEWWQRLDPLTRRQLVEKYPDAVGGAVGLPSRYRDAANRIVLGRRHEQLLAERERLDAAHDGAGSPGLQRVEMDLAATERLRKADGYLVDYQPGNEQHTRLSDGNDPKWDALWVF